MVNSSYISRPEGGVLSSLGGILDGIPKVPESITADLALEERMQQDIFSEKKRRKWNRDDEARCDFDRHPGIRRTAGVWVHYLWRKSVKGRTLTEIKADDSQIRRFALELGNMTAQILGPNLRNCGWAVVTAPPRRHTGRNFAVETAKLLASRLDIPFRPNVAFCTSRQRIGAVYTPGTPPPEANLIVFDDIVTTGSTLKSLTDVLKEMGKSVFLIVGINNSM